MAALEYVLSSLFPRTSTIPLNQYNKTRSQSLSARANLIEQFLLPFVVWAESVWYCSYDMSECRVHECVSLCIRDVPNWARVPRRGKKNHKRSESVAGISILIFTLLSPKKNILPHSHPQSPSVRVSDPPTAHQGYVHGRTVKES